MEIMGILNKLGLDTKTVAIYSALVETGPSTISAISSQTGIHRPLIYKGLPLLLEKGLVSLSPRGKQKRYVAESPDKLRGLVQQIVVDVDGIIPELKSRYQANEKRPHIKYLEGKRGITSVFEDLITTLKRGDVFYRYSSAKDSKRADSYLPTNYRAVRDQKQLERFVITSETEAAKKKLRMERSIKSVPAKHDLFDYDITQLIYANKVVFIDYGSETVVVIENDIIATFQRRIFKLLFSKL